MRFYSEIKTPGSGLLEDILDTTPLPPFPSLALARSSFKEDAGTRAFVFRSVTFALDSL